MNIYRGSDLVVYGKDWTGKGEGGGERRLRNVLKDVKNIVRPMSELCVYA